MANTIGQTPERPRKVSLTNLRGPTTLFLVILTGTIAPATAQSVDAAVEVKEGAMASLTADAEIAIVTGTSALFTDEKWFVTGACSNRPTIRLALKTGTSALFAERKVGITRSRFSADQTICVTNAEELSHEMKEALGLDE